ncbi:MAG: phosphatase PAP2 family protein [Pseudorhodoplanes sp.]
MTAIELRPHSETTVTVRGERRGAAWIGYAGAVMAIVLAMTFVDEPVARAVAEWPHSLTVQIAAAAGFAKGGYLIAAAFILALVSFAAFLAASGRARALFGDLSLASAFVLLATVVALACATILKVLIGRARPELLAIYGPHAFFPFSTSHQLTSFPSGETSMVLAFFGAMAIMARRRLGNIGAMGLLVPALLIVASRPVVGAHYVSDVLAAALLAVLILSWMARVWERNRGRLSERQLRFWSRLHGRAAAR